MFFFFFSISPYFLLHRFLFSFLILRIMVEKLTRIVYRFFINWFLLFYFLTLHFFWPHTTLLTVHLNVYFFLSLCVFFFFPLLFNFFLFYSFTFSFSLELFPWFCNFISRLFTFSFSFFFFPNWTSLIFILDKYFTCFFFSS